MADEPAITINGQPLDVGQSMTVRVAIETFAMCLEDGMMDDANDKALVAAYRARIVEIRRLMHNV